MSRASAIFTSALFSSVIAASCSEATVGSSVAPEFDVSNLCSDKSRDVWSGGADTFVDALDSKMTGENIYQPATVIACNIWSEQSSERLKKSCSSGQPSMEIQFAVAGMQTFWRLAFQKTEDVFGDSQMDIQTGILGLEVSSFSEEQKSEMISDCEVKYEDFMLTNFEGLN